MPPVDHNHDLMADLIHRGRDHGLPTYADVRSRCGLAPVARFAELNNTVDADVIRALESGEGFYFILR